jgi:hypothetical protein
MWKNKIGLAFVIILALYGFYVIGRDLFSRDFVKIATVLIGIPLIWFTTKIPQTNKNNATAVSNAQASTLPGRAETITSQKLGGAINKFYFFFVIIFATNYLIDLLSTRDVRFAVMSLLASVILYGFGIAFTIYCFINKLRYAAKSLAVYTISVPIVIFVIGAVLALHYINLGYSDPKQVSLALKENGTFALISRVFSFSGIFLWLWACVDLFSGHLRRQNSHSASKEMAN